MIYIIVLSFLLIEYQANLHVHACEIADDCPKNSPEQIRVALRGNNTITISWRTSGMPNGSDDTPSPRVQYSANSTLEGGTIMNGTSSTYTTVGTISWFHDVIIYVNYSTTYYYQILESQCANYSDTYSFRSQPAPGDKTPMNITIVGDIGYDSEIPLFNNNNSASQTMRRLLEVSKYTRLFLHVGDISYADDPAVQKPQDIFTALNFTFYEKQWNEFQVAMQPVTANNIYMTAPGNHEVTCVQLSDCYCELMNASEIGKQYRNFSAYLYRFAMPGADSDYTYKNLWYSFDYGLAHIVVINTETDFEGAPAGPNTTLNGGNFKPNGTQVRWLENDLANATKNRCKVPWIIVVGHRPWYGSVPQYKHRGELKSDNCPSCRDAFAKILFDHKVDFYFSGHVHWYERLWPVNENGDWLAKNYTDPQGPIYITTGAGGAPEGAQDKGTQANASAIIKSNYGFSQLQIFNSTTAELYFYESFSMDIFDNVTITRRDPCPTSCSN